MQPSFQSNCQINKPIATTLFLCALYGCEIGTVCEYVPQSGVEGARAYG